MNKDLEGKRPQPDELRRRPTVRPTVAAFLMELQTVVEAIHWSKVEHCHG